MLKDKAEKVLEDYNDVFADIYNTLVFEESFLQEDKLEAGSTESVYKSEQGALKEQRRDVLKVYRDSNLLLLSLGVENQSTIEKNMPVRIMGYDYQTYRRLLDSGKELAPVVTIVLNFADKRWNGPKSLHELLNIPEKIKPYVQDYGIKVFDIAYLREDVIERFTSDFKLVARFFKDKRIGDIRRAMQDDTTALKHVEATLDLLKVFANDDRYAEVYDAELKAKVERGEDVYMCTVADSFEKKGIEQGIQQGIQQGIEQGIEQGIQQGIEQGELRMLLALVRDNEYPIEKAAKRAGKSVAEFEELLDRGN